MESVTLHSRDEMRAFAGGVVRGLAPRNTATVLALSGDLGAGKTTFTQCLADALGVTETVTSPTFLVMRSYELRTKAFKRLIHIDAYRIDEEDEARVIGLGDLLLDPENIIVIEWAERIPSYIPEDAFRFMLAHGEGETRTISFSAHGNN